MKRHTSIGEVLEAVNQHLVGKNAERKGASPVRLSASGSCARKLAYGLHYPEQASELSHRALSVFALGHTLHDQERELIRKVAILHSEEWLVRLPIEVDGRVVEVEGHLDGIVEMADGPALIDIKTMSRAGFEQTQRDGVSYEYRAQLNAYMEATGIRRAYLWAYCKDTSHRTVFAVRYDPALVEEVKERFRRVLRSSPEALPEREFTPQAEIRKGQPSGREYLPWQCSYCSYNESCWAGTGFVKVIENGKPRWIRPAQPQLAEVAL